MKFRAFLCIAGICICVFAAVVIKNAVERRIMPQNTGEVSSDAVIMPEDDPLAEFILQQEQLRSLQLSGLDSIVNSPETSQEIRDSAQQEKLDLLRCIETEQTVSGILRARGYEDAACSMGDGYVTVMVRSPELEKSDIARITELIVSQTGLKAENIKIIPIN